KIVKWVRRNPGIAALSSALAATLLGIVVLGFVLLNQGRVEAVAQREAAVGEMNEAMRLKQEAEENERRARREAYASQLNLAQNALHDAQFDRAKDLLAGLKPSGGREDLRGFEWFYLWRVSH